MLRAKNIWVAGGDPRQAALAGLGREEVLGILEGAWAKQEGSDGK